MKKDDFEITEEERELILKRRNAIKENEPIAIGELRDDMYNTGTFFYVLINDISNIIDGKIERYSTVFKSDLASAVDEIKKEISEELDKAFNDVISSNKYPKGTKFIKTRGSLKYPWRLESDNYVLFSDEYAEKYLINIQELN